MIVGDVKKKIEVKCVCVGGLIYPSRISTNNCPFLTNFYTGLEYSFKK